MSGESALTLRPNSRCTLIGDGRLPNAGPEQIADAQYNLPVFSFARGTTDYQFIKNPAYDTDLGPSPSSRFAPVQF